LHSVPIPIRAPAVPAGGSAAQFRDVDCFAAERCVAVGATFKPDGSVAPLIATLS
jgi:hypothetical protein